MYVESSIELTSHHLSLVEIGVFKGGTDVQTCEPFFVEELIVYK